MFAGVVRDGGVFVPFLADEWNPWEDEQVEYNSALIKKREAFQQHLGRIDKNKPKRYKVQIWGKAAIGKFWINRMSVIHYDLQRRSVLSTHDGNALTFQTVVFTHKFFFRSFSDCR